MTIPTPTPWSRSFGDSDWKPLVANLKVDGYEPVNWMVHPNGTGADRNGRVLIPLKFSTKQMCMTRGNLVRLRRESFLGRENQWARNFDVFPCICFPSNLARFICRSWMTIAEAKASPVLPQKPEIQSETSLIPAPEVLSKGRPARKITSTIARQLPTTLRRSGVIP